MPYAAQTRVPISKTKTDIEELLAKHGAAGFGYVTEGDRAMVAFNMSGRRIRLMLVMPSIDDSPSPSQLQADGGGSTDGVGIGLPATLGGVLLVIKAKLEAATAGISTMEAEFLSNIVLPDNTIAGDWMIPQIDQAYRTGVMPLMLPAGGGQGGRPIALPPAEKRAS